MFICPYNLILSFDETYHLNHDLQAVVIFQIKAYAVNRGIIKQLDFFYIVLSGSMETVYICYMYLF